MEMEAEREVYIKHAPDILDGLNESQKQAVAATDTHLLVVAGPGTGKTLTIVRRIAHLLQQGVSPDQIVAVTFTNRAAREMRERIEALLKTQARIHRYLSPSRPSTHEGESGRAVYRLYARGTDYDFEVDRRERYKGAGER